MVIVTPAADLFRHNVRFIMDRDGITMQALAERVGTSRPGISRILSGQDGVTLNRAERIAKALGEPLFALLGERPEPASSSRQGKTPRKVPQNQTA